MVVESAAASTASAPAGAAIRSVATPAARSGSPSPGRAARAGDARLWELAGRLTDRDRQLCHLLHEHRVLTTSQVADVGFTGLRKAQRRLIVLHHLQVVDRFRPRSWSGSGPYHLTLGPAGAVVVADLGVSVADLGWRRDAASALALSQRLGHLVGVNGFFTALLRVARTRPGGALAEWWSERRCAAAWGQLVRPDGYAVWVDGDARLPFCFEYDTAPNASPAWPASSTGTPAAAAAAGHPTWVLFAFRTPAREAAARTVLAHPEVAVATAALPPRYQPSRA